MKAYLESANGEKYIAEIEHDDEYVPRVSGATRPELMYKVIGNPTEIKTVRWNTEPIITIRERPIIGVVYMVSMFRCYPITDDEAAEILNREAAAKRSEIEARIASIDRQIGHLDRDALPTDREAAETRKRWINTYNEGGEGYVPEIMTREMYDMLAAKRDKLAQELA